MREPKNDSFKQDDAFFWILLIILISIVLIIVFSFKRRSSIAPKVCPYLCGLKKELYYAHETTDLGINCICRPKPKPVIIYLD